MAAVVRAGEKGVDFSFNRPPPARLLELDYTFVVGYISTPPANPRKNLTTAEILGYIEAGLKVLLVAEWSATTPNQGRERGIKDGRDSKHLLQAHGQPLDVPVLVACDTNTTAALAPAHEAYVRGFAEAVKPYPIGVYGDTDLLALVKDICQVGWVPNAWAWSSTSRKAMEDRARSIGAHVLQRTGYWIDSKWAVDPNEAIRDFPAWGNPEQHKPVIEPERPIERPTIEPATLMEDDDMIFYTNSDDHQGFGPRKWQYALIHDGEQFTKYHITNGAVAALDMPDKGFKFYPRTSDELKSIPDFEGMKSVPVGPAPTFGPMSVVFSGTGIARPE